MKIKTTQKQQHKGKLFLDAKIIKGSHSDKFIKQTHF